MNLKQKTQSAKKFVHDHKVAIAVTVTSVCWIALNKRNMNEVDRFLKDHDLYEEFWNSEEYGI